MQIILTILALWQPVHDRETEALARFVVRVQPKAVLYARPLANRIFAEAKAAKLDPTVLAAIVWMESWYDRRARGSDHERGLWQIYPPASRLKARWAELRQQKAVPKRWDRPWSRMPMRTRQAVARDLRLGTALAVDLIVVFVRHCRANHRDHRRPTDAYAHYNSGFAWPRLGYSYQLWRRTRIIRRAIGRPAVTDAEQAWMGRVVHTASKRDGREKGVSQAQGPRAKHGTHR